MLLQTQYVAFLCFAGMTHSSSPYLYDYTKPTDESFYLGKLVKLDRKEVQVEWVKKLGRIMMIFVNKIFI